MPCLQDRMFSKHVYVSWSGIHILLTISCKVHRLLLMYCSCICVCVSVDPTKMGGLSMLLLAGEHALTAREVLQQHYNLLGCVTAKDYRLSGAGVVVRTWAWESALLRKAIITFTFVISSSWYWQGFSIGTWQQQFSHSRDSHKTFCKQGKLQLIQIHLSPSAVIINERSHTFRIWLLLKRVQQYFGYLLAPQSIFISERSASWAH